MSDESQTTNSNRLIILKSARDTNGRMLEMEAHYPANSPKPPSHYHPYQEEKFQVLDGEFMVSINGFSQLFKPGYHFMVPIGVHHWMHNISNKPGRLNWQVRPAMKTQSLLQTLWGLEAEANGSNKKTNLLQLAVILHEHRNEFHLTSPPYAVQHLLFGLLSPLGRLFGYQPSYPWFASPS